MADFRVEWSIDITADTPQEAARKAWDIMRRPETTATVFDTYNHDSGHQRVDLLEEEGWPEQMPESTDA